MKLKIYTLLLALSVAWSLQSCDNTNLIALGTLNHNSPVAIPVAISVVPTPVEKAPNAQIGRASCRERV